MERSVVGFVLADRLLNVRKSLMNDDDDCDGLGEGGDVGGRGRNEASSSASRSRAFDREPQTELAIPLLERRLLASSSSTSSIVFPSTSVMFSVLLSDMGFETGRVRMR